MPGLKTRPTYDCAPLHAKRSVIGFARRTGPVKCWYAGSRLGSIESRVPLVRPARPAQSRGVPLRSEPGRSGGHSGDECSRASVAHLAKRIGEPRVSVVRTARAAEDRRLPLRGQAACGYHDRHSWGRSTAVGVGLRTGLSDRARCRRLHVLPDRLPLLAWEAACARTTAATAYARNARETQGSRGRSRRNTASSLIPNP